jgi:hypothetical protein
MALANKEWAKRERSTVMAALRRAYKWRWWPLALAVLAALLILALTTTAAHAREANTLPSVVYTQNQCVLLYRAPLTSSTVLADAIPGTGLRVVGINSTAEWYHALFLGQMPVWVQLADVATSYQTNLGEDDSCPFQNIPAIAPTPVTGSKGPYALNAAGTIVQSGELRSAPGTQARVTGELYPGARAYVSAWAADTNGDIWYQTHVAGSLGWVWAYALRFDGPDPATASVNGTPVWSGIAGKGLWFTDYLPHHTDITALVAAAKALGVTHLYPRVAETSYGFYDQNTLNRLLPVAHAAGMKVIAWVYPYLRNVANDLIMTQAVATYRTPSGDQVDGIIADIEERTDAPAVFAYGQVLRQMVGPGTLLIASTYNPIGRPSYPYAEVAASFNVISPQDYWHDTPKGTFDANSPRQLLTISIMTIRAELGGEQIPIEEDGQMYDQFSYGEPGGHQPSAAEITGDLQAAKDLGCVSISFFDWRTASPDELDALRDFTW